MNFARNNSRRVAAVWVCLFAAICLYAPMALAAWPAAATCCHGNSCAIPEHHHRQADTDAGNGARCEHGVSGISACGMSCCHDVEGASFTSMAYVMPLPLTISAPIGDAQRISVRSSDEFLRSLQPLPPPPRV
jgi:hypothetical protein